MNLNRDLKEFIESLNANAVRYLIVGGYARLELELDGVRVCFIDLENLKRNKLATGRYQDLADVENLSR